MRKIGSPVLLTLIVCSLVLTPLWPPRNATASPPDESELPEATSVAVSAQDVPPPVQQLINNLFQIFNNVIVPFADKVNQWKNEAQAAAQKTVEDFTSCPSPAAQNLYNDLRSRRNNLDQTISIADQQDDAARAARTNCRNQVPTNFRPACDVAYNNLPFAGIKASAQAARNTVNTAMTHLRNLRCVSGCSRTASFLFPTVSVRPTTVTVPTPSAQVCTQWDPGSFRFDNNSTGTTLSATVTAELPRCARTQTVSACDWELSVLLPILRELKLVPPEVQPGNLRIEVPTSRLRVVSGLNQVSCSQPFVLCTRVRHNFDVTLDLGGDVNAFLRDFIRVNSGQCEETRTVGCQEPPFGLAPAYRNFDVPDPTRARISWSGGRIRPGSVTVDLTQRRFTVACRAQSLDLPGVPQIVPGSQRVDLPYLCVQPQTRSVVANP